MKKILGLLINKKTLVVIGLFLFSLIIWVGGELAGISANLRAFAIFFFLTQALILFIVKLFFASKQSAEIEGYLNSQVEQESLSMGLESQDTMEAVKSQLNEAIDSIKKSKLSGKWFTGGSSALYELPWYIIIGPPSGGKSTLLKTSSLHFPQLSDSGKGIQGVGGTRNCDWWFSNEAIFLDTAGRYSTEDADNEEWLGFLDLLKKHLKRKPINGTILGVCVSELLEATDDELEATANKLRDRLDELINRLQVNVPVYLTFMKCDLISGFVEFFSTLSLREREQVWGCTFTTDELKGTNPEQVFESEFHRLGETLEARRLHTLDTAVNQKQRENILLFPVQFEATQKRLLQFIKILVQPNPYQEVPLFRGFYFTCGTQEGNPIDLVISKMGSSLNLSQSIIDSLETEQEKKSYFIKDLMTKVVIPDQLLGRLTTKTALFQKFASTLSLVVPAVLSALLCLAFFISFQNNKASLKALKYHMVETNGIDWESRSGLAENIATMDLLRDDLFQMYRNRESGVPFFSGWGFYQGEKVDAPARRVYFEKFREFCLVPLARTLESDIAELTRKHPAPGSADWKLLYDSLKLYLMLGTPKKGDVTFMSKELLPLWKKQLRRVAGKNEDSDRIFSKGVGQLDFFLSQTGREDLPQVKLNELTVKTARDELSNIPVTERLYSNLISDAAKLETFSLRRHLSDSARVTVKTGYELPGAFTRRGWKNQIKDSIEKAFDLSNKDDWVLGDGTKSALDEKDKEKWIKNLRVLYLQNYIMEWKKLVSNTDIAVFRGLDDTLQKLEILSDSGTSPISTFFQKLKENLELEKTGSVLSQAKDINIIKKGMKKLGLGTKSNINKNDNPLVREYHGIVLFSDGEDGADKPSPLAQYMEALKALSGELLFVQESGEPGAEALLYAGKVFARQASALNTGLRITESLVKDLDSSLKNELRTLLTKPFHYTWKVILDLASAHLSNRWENTVYNSFSQSLKGRYPFIKGRGGSAYSGSEAAILDVSEFFKPGEGVLWSFYGKEVKKFVKEGSTSIVPKKWRGQGLNLSPGFSSFIPRAKTITKALFSGSSVSPAVSYKIQPLANPFVSEVFVAIDGKEYSFLNSPNEWPGFSWPDTSGIPGAEITVKVWKEGWSEEKTLKKQAGGEWAFFKLLEDSDIKREASGKFRIRWNFKTGGNKSAPVIFQLKASRFINPFRKGFFSGLNVPRRII
ncbi:MAG: type VI secretion system membrane subunit TssM [Nitrospinota bacterium]